MKVAVTGASGHVGANLVRSLIEKGDSVRCLVHSHRRSIEGLDVECTRGDIRDPSSIREAFEDIEIVYHLASRISISMKDWPLVEAINVQGTRNVIDACRHSGVRRLVHFSSIHAIRQRPFDVPVNEDSPLVDGQAAPYDRSKAASEKLVLDAVRDGLDAVIIAPTAVVGPHDYEPSYFGDVLVRIAQKKLPALVGAGFDWVDVRDTVSGTLAAAVKAPAGSKYLLSGEWIAIPEIAAMLEEITGNACTRRTLPLWLASAGAPFVETYCNMVKARPLYTKMSLHSLKSNRSISHDKAARELGYAPRAFRVTLEDTMRWFQQAGMLSCKGLSGGQI